jgi:hypothetical protein
MWAEGDHEVLDCAPVNAGQAGGRSEGIALYEVLENCDLLLSGEDIRH